jgi:hypothetical protein
VARGGAVLTVEADAAAVEERLIDGRLSCPGCGAVLGPWGWARTRVLRGVIGESVVLRPQRALCSGCGVSHVLLPVFVLLRLAIQALVATFAANKSLVDETAARAAVTEILD